MSEAPKHPSNPMRISNPSMPRPGDARSTQRKTAPSPLQVTQISTPITDTFMHDSREMGSPRSPIPEPIKSPREKLEDLLSMENTGDNREPLPASTAASSKNSPVTVSKEGAYRNVSAPVSLPNSTTTPRSHKQYPSELSTSMRRTPIDKAEGKFVPRNTSIDSTMSSVSSNSYQYMTQDQISPLPSDIQNAISAAGSAEAAIHALLKEKRNSTKQNAQLWGLVNKQRSFILGLQKDLDRALSEKERYRKKYKELELAHKHTPVRAAAAARLEKSPTPTRSGSPTGSESDELPIQRHSVLEKIPSQGNSVERSSVRTVEEANSPPASSSSTSSLPRDSPQSEGHSMGLGLVDASQQPNTASRQQHRAPEEPPKVLSIITSPSLQGINKVMKSSLPDRSSPVSPDVESTATRRSFTARRSLTSPQKSQPSPKIEKTPVAEDFPIITPTTRKAPPAPLTLVRPTAAAVNHETAIQDDQSGSEYDEIVEVDEIPAFERGRRKTREDDDKERELALLKEQESRSQSKKSKRSKSAADKIVKEPPPPIQLLPKSPAIRSFSPEDSYENMSRHLSPPTSLASVLSRPPSSANTNSTTERTLLTPFPLSPGLPSSPRPIDRPLNSPPPRLPRDGVTKFLVSPPLSPRVGPPLPLSPRPPRREIPLPPHTPASMMSPMSTKVENEETSRESPDLPQSPASPHPPQSPRFMNPPQSPRGIQSNGASSSADNGPTSPRGWIDPATMGPGGVYRGLVADAYPDLLLPPNALPSILVKVISSRLKATRHSILSVRSSEEEALFTLGVWARSDMQQLWRVEKATMSLPQLASRLKQTAKFDVPLPDRSLFQGHAPAKMDARREAIEKYFETVLDSPMNEKGAVVVCQYLSTDVMQTEEIDANGTLWRSGPRSPVVGSDGRPLKEGFLTKRGKNFGGWKSRYFILDDPILRYYETAAGSKGPLLGTIKLTNAQIGKQRSDNGSPARGNERAVDDSIKEFRHALCINEPKRNGGFIRHILCAESDEERDEWVEALLQYVGASPVEKDKGRKSSKKDETSSNRMSSKTSRNKDAARENSIHSNLPEEPEPDETEGLQSVNYEDTLPAQQPSRSMSSAMSIANQPEPSSPQLDATAQNMGRLQGPKIISGPTNGGVIQDAAQWGFKTPESPKAKEKEPRKRGIWGFREKPSNDGITTHSNDSNSDLGDRSLTGEKGSNNQGSSYGRAVFGIPLAEAVDQFTATGNNACLPAVMFRCLEYLEDKNASNEEGIFRLSGSSTLIKQLKERFNTEGDVDLLADGHYYDVHAVASLLKLYLRELPTTVLTRELHIDFLDVLKLEDKAAKITAYNNLVHRLPMPNWNLLRALSAFLISIVQNADVSKMSVRNITIVFSPTLNIPGPVFSAFLTDYDAIFGQEPTSPSPIQVTPASPELSADDIRSPRRQLFSEIPTPSYTQSTFASNGLGLTYDDVLHNTHHDHVMGTGFTPLQPSYENPQPASLARKPSVTMPGPEYGAFQRTLGSNLTAQQRDTKARRRESSMLLMGNNGLQVANRKSSMPVLNGGSFEEE